MVLHTQHCKEKQSKIHFWSPVILQLLQFSLKNSFFVTFYIFIRKGSAPGQPNDWPISSFFYCTSDKSWRRCNLLPLASCKAIPSTPAVINLSLWANYFLQISDNDGRRRAGFMVKVKWRNKQSKKDVQEIRNMKRSAPWKIVSIVCIRSHLWAGDSRNTLNTTSNK